MKGSHKYGISMPEKNAFDFVQRPPDQRDDAVVSSHNRSKDHESGKYKLKKKLE